MRFKLDENVPAELASLLRAAGYDADTIAQEGLEGAQDGHVSDVCRREQRILVTFDLGFSDIRAYPPQEYPGLMVLRLWRQDTDYVLTVFGKVIQFLAAERIDGQLWVVEEDRIRIRDASGQ
jgi:predicted nuclease of predicted toxin-antitoxin system